MQTVFKQQQHKKKEKPQLMATLFMFQKQLLHMHWVCSALKTFLVMWAAGYNNSYLDGAVVSMT